jgi:hypothetical protein
MVEPETEIKLEINSEIDENIKLERSESVENKVTTRIRSRNRNQVGPKECHVRKCGCRKGNVREISDLRKEIAEGKNWYFFDRPIF